MLKYRVLTAVVLIPIFLALLFKLPPVGFCIFTGIVVLWGAWEWSALMGLEKTSTRLIYPLVFLIALVGAFELSVINILTAAVVGWLSALVLVILYPKGSARWGRSIILRGLMGLFVLIPCWLALNYIRNANDGIFILLYLFVIIWSADIGAYFVGKKWGKNKLAPEVSPGKTWQGLAGALLMTILITFAVLVGFDMPKSTWLLAIILSLITVLFSVLGDLFESMLKRNVGLKDSGHLLPGHGGLLDRIDSLTAAAPVFALGATLIGNFFIN